VLQQRLNVEVGARGRVTELVGPDDVHEAGHPLLGGVEVGSEVWNLCHALQRAPLR